MRILGEIVNKCKRAKITVQRQPCIQYIHFEFYCLEYCAINIQMLLLLTYLCQFEMCKHKNNQPQLSTELSNPMTLIFIFRLQKEIQRLIHLYKKNLFNKNSLHYIHQYAMIFSYHWTKVLQENRIWSLISKSIFTVPTITLI